MKLNDLYIAKFVGGVFFDPLTSARSEKEWGELCEKVRPAVREGLNKLGIFEQLKVKTASNGFQFNYEVASVEHTLSVTADQVNFDCGKFKVIDGIPKYLPNVLHGILTRIGRDDWTEIGTAIGLAFPATAATSKESCVSANFLAGALLNPSQDFKSEVFAGGTVSRVDLSLRGEVDKARFDFNVYNLKEQHLAVTLDVRMSQPDVESIEKFFGAVFQAFTVRCGPLAERILSAPELAKTIDLEWLTTGRK